MSKEDDRILILRFKNQENLKSFFEFFEDHEAGSLVKIGNDSDYSNNKEKDGKETRFSEWGMENLDKKNSEKPSLI